MRTAGSAGEGKAHRGKGHWCAARIATGLGVAVVNISLFTAVAKGEPITSVCAEAPWSNFSNGGDSRCRIGAVGFYRLPPDSTAETPTGTTELGVPHHRKANLKWASGMDKTLMEKMLIDLTGISAVQRYLGDPEGLFAESRDQAAGRLAAPGPGNRRTGPASAEGAKPPESRWPECLRWSPLAVLAVALARAFATFANSRRRRTSGLMTSGPEP